MRVIPATKWSQIKRSAYEHAARAKEPVGVYLYRCGDPVLYVVTVARSQAAYHVNGRWQRIAVVYPL